MKISMGLIFIMFVLIFSWGTVYAEEDVLVFKYKVKNQLFKNITVAAGALFPGSSSRVTRENIPQSEAVEWEIKMPKYAFSTEHVAELAVIIPASEDKEAGYCKWWFVTPERGKARIQLFQGDKNYHCEPDSCDGTACEIVVK